MCFSASASFGAGAILSVIGVLSLKKGQSRSEIAFAAIPLIFSIQQISEGFLWLALTKPEYAWLQQFTTYTFLTFAQVIWPIWVPVSILLLEKKEQRRTIQKIIVAIGAAVSIYLGFCLFTYNVEARVEAYHISYKLNFPAYFSGLGSLLYIIATVTPPYFSSINRMWTLSTAIFISYIITAVFYIDYIISVWCFFASIISITVLVIMSEVRKRCYETDSIVALQS